MHHALVAPLSARPQPRYMTVSLCVLRLALERRPPTHTPQLLRKRGQHEEARTLLNEAHDSRVTVLGEDHPSTLDSKHQLARLLHDTSACSSPGAREAKIWFQLVLRKRSESLREDHPATVATKQAYGLHLCTKDKETAESMKRGADMLEATAKSWEDLFGKDTPLTKKMLAEVARARSATVPY